MHLKLLGIAQRRIASMNRSTYAILLVIALFLLVSTLEYRWNVEPRLSPAAQVSPAAIPAAPDAAGLSMQYPLDCDATVTQGGVTRCYSRSTNER